MRMGLVMAIGAMGAALAGPAQASWVQWTGPGSNGHWYRLVEDNTKGWTAAKAAAEALGGHLVTITSGAEQSFLNTALFGGTAAPGQVATPGLIGSWWMGATDAAVEGTWSWITGEPFGPFTNWGAGQPDNNTGALFGGPGGEDYGQFVWRNGWTSPLPGGWNDAREAGYLGPDYANFPQLQLKGYIVERTTSPFAVPTPGALGLFGLALAALALARRRG